MKCVHLTISGHVQGVCFRAYTQKEAGRLGLVGWVKNLPDGRVEVLAQGMANQVESLVKWCHAGPRAARVDGVTRQDEAVNSALKGFLVR